ncbi:MAG: lysine--tRNA ligase [Rickettsiaceae bacterium]|nr:lysine--tRNA ligase [Rickettsiaceae bacterium]
MILTIEQAKESKAWPFLEAIKILEKIDHKTPKKGYVLFETGYGPSGLPHIGTFAEVARTTMIIRAFKQLSNIPTKLICFSDDLDGLRKVPSNIPNQDMVARFMNMPLTSIPDPFGEKESYGHYMNSKLCSFLDAFGFDYEFMSATQCYKSGLFDSSLEFVLEKYDEIMDVMLASLRDERRATYSPFMPICEETGQVLQVPILEVNKTKKTIIYKNLSGKIIETKVTGGKCKLQWKPDFGMRWANLEVDYEMYGKDHMPNGPLYSRICQILGGTPPVQFFYELFLDELGAKISKSKGNSISVDEWLSYAPLESLELFIYHSPGKAKRLYFDVIPKTVDEYINFNKKYNNSEDLSAKLSNPLHHIHDGNVPNVETANISFSLLLNLASVCNPENKEVLWGFIASYLKDASPKTYPYLDKLTGFALKYYNDFVKTNKKYLEPSQNHINILVKLKKILEGSSSNDSGEEIQSKIYNLGMEEGYENLREFFKDLYMILLGQEEGPRLGSFFKLYGLNNSIELIESRMHKTPLDV